MSNTKVYVSITGLQLKSWRYFFKFWWHAVRSMTQAKSAPGNISTETHHINGMQHTLSVWVDEAAMRQYLVSGAHRQAMATFHSIATGKTFGFYANKAPTWSEAYELWKQNGKSVG
jgi:hypothetical protein